MANSLRHHGNALISFEKSRHEHVHDPIRSKEGDELARGSLEIESKTRFDEVVCGRDRCVRKVGRDDLCGLRCSQEWTRPDAPYGSGGEVLPKRVSLADSLLAQVKVGEMAVDHPFGVVDIAMTNEKETFGWGCHRLDATRP